MREDRQFLVDTLNSYLIDLEGVDEDRYAQELLTIRSQIEGIKEVTDDG